MWLSLGFALRRADIGPGFFMIGASGSSMAAGRLTLCCDLLVPVYGCGRLAAGFVIGLGLIIRAGLDRSHWLVGTLL